MAHAADANTHLIVWAACFLVAEDSVQAPDPHLLSLDHRQDQFRALRQSLVAQDCAAGFDGDQVKTTTPPYSPTTSLKNRRILADPYSEDRLARYHQHRRAQLLRVE